MKGRCHLGNFTKQTDGKSQQVSVLGEAAPACVGHMEGGERVMQQHLFS